MLRMTLTSSALAALLLTACDQPMDQRAQRDQQSQSPTEQAMGEQQTAPAPMDQQTDQSGANTLQPQQTAAIPLTDVQNPEQTLTNAPVRDSKGEAIGEVKSVSLGPDGRVQMVNVGIGTRTVALEATSLKYVQADNTIVSEKSKDEIQQTP